MLSALTKLQYDAGGGAAAGGDGGGDGLIDVLRAKVQRSSGGGSKGSGGGGGGVMDRESTRGCSLCRGSAHCEEKFVIQPRDGGYRGYSGGGGCHAGGGALLVGRTRGRVVMHSCPLLLKGVRKREKRKKKQEKDLIWNVGGRTAWDEDDAAGSTTTMVGSI